MDKDVFEIRINKVSSNIMRVNDTEKEFSISNNINIIKEESIYNGNEFEIMAFLTDSHKEAYIEIGFSNSGDYDDDCDTIKIKYDGINKTISEIHGITALGYDVTLNSVPNIKEVIYISLKINPEYAEMISYIKPNKNIDRYIESKSRRSLYGLGIGSNIFGDNIKILNRKNIHYVQINMD